MFKQNHPCLKPVQPCIEETTAQGRNDKSRIKKKKFIILNVLVEHRTNGVKMHKYFYAKM